MTFSPGNTPWNKGLTSELSLKVAAAALKRCGFIGWKRGLTKESDSRVADLAEKLKGRTKETHLGVASQAEKLKGRIPWNKGLTKETNADVARNANNSRGRRCWCNGLTKKEYPQLSKSEATRALMSEIMLRRLADNPEYAKAILRQRKPNKAEIMLQGILDKYFPDQWKYVGNGQLIIGGKLPDFTNINDRKLLIELFGERWHNPNEVMQRTEHFRKYGYTCLIIWTRELRNEESLATKISSFF